MSAGSALMRWKILLPVFVLLAAIAGTVTLATGKAPQLVAQRAAVTTVRVITARPQSVRVPVRSQGVLMPVREIELGAAVQGRVVALHPEFVAGGRFKAGDVLVSIEPGAYDLAIVQTQTRLAEAKRVLAEEEAAAVQAKREWRVLGQGSPTPLSLHEPQLLEARAKLKLAEAELADAKLRRSFCDIRAPFAGRVREKLIGVGQFAEVGQVLGRIFDYAAAEIRLPLTAEQTAYLDGPESGAKAQNPKVMLRSEQGSQAVQRQAIIVRREGVIEAGTGLEYWVARLEHPGREPALLPGTFVTAEIEGRELDGVFVLPQAALNAAQEAWLVDAGTRLKIKRLEVLHRDADHVLVNSGLMAGDRLVVSGVDVPVAGMPVVVDAEN